MIHLITSYFVDKNPERQAEINRCLKNNVDNSDINLITIIQDTYKDVSLFSKTKITYAHERPTFDLFFHYAKPDCWNVIANSDIYFDETIKLLEQRNTNEFVALCRYDVGKKGKATFLNRRDAQDAWAFYGKPKESLKADFYQGVPGCDNVLLYNAKKAGYAISNPSLTIKAYHLHNSGIRNYTQKDKLMPPYELLTPHI